MGEEKDLMSVLLMELRRGTQVLSVLSQMKEQMEADKNVTYFLDPATDGFSGLTGEESFYLSESGSLIVAFDEYSVAPGSMGAVEFTIPESLVGTFD